MMRRRRLDLLANASSFNGACRHSWEKTPMLHLSFNWSRTGRPLKRLYVIRVGSRS